MQLSSLKQIARQLNVSEATIRRLIERGELPGIRIGRVLRVDQADVEALIRRWRTNATTKRK